MSRLIAIDDLIDANGVADIVGLTHRNSVSLYQRRYEDMPRPVVELSGGRTKLWLRSEVQRWVERQDPHGHARRKRRSGR